MAEILYVKLSHEKVSAQDTERNFGSEVFKLYITYWIMETLNASKMEVPFSNGPMVMLSDAKRNVEELIIIFLHNFFLCVKETGMSIGDVSTP